MCGTKCVKGMVFEHFWLEIGYRFYHFDMKVCQRVRILQKGLWILKTRSENGYEVSRPGLKKGAGKLYILV